MRPFLNSCEYGLKLLACRTAAPRKTLFETVNTSTGINNFLLTRVKRVTLGTYVEGNFFSHRRASFNDISATAGGGHIAILRLNILLHKIASFAHAATRSAAEHRILVNIMAPKRRRRLSDISPRQPFRGRAYYQKVSSAQAL